METQKLISRLSTRGLLPRAMAVLICECWSSDSCGAPLFSWIVSDVVPGGTLQSVCDCAAANPPNPTTAATATVANNLFLISALLVLRKAQPRLFRITKCRYFTGSTRLRAVDVPQRSARSYRNRLRNSSRSRRDVSGSFRSDRHRQWLDLYDDSLDLPRAEAERSRGPGRDWPRARAQSSGARSRGRARLHRRSRLRRRLPHPARVRRLKSSCCSTSPASRSRDGTTCARRRALPKRACEHEHQPLATTARSGSDCNCAS